MPTVTPGCNTGGSASRSRKVVFGAPFPLHHVSLEKAVLNFFPGLSCQGRAQRVASACHVTLVFAVSHAMTSQADWRTMEITLLYVKMEKLSLSRKQPGEHQLQMGMKKKCLSEWMKG